MTPTPHHIIILSIDNQPQWIGGIKRVTSTLGHEWQQDGHTVCFMTSCTSSLRPEAVNGIPQHFLPQPQAIYSPENISFLADYIRNDHTTILLNPHVEDRELTKLAMAVRQQVPVKLVSALHFSPTHTYDITRESFFIPYHIHHRPKQWVTDAFLWIRFHLYQGKRIRKREKTWQQTVIEGSDHFVVLSQQFLSHFEGQKDKLAWINNPISFQETERNPSKRNVVVWCGRMDLTGMKRVDRILQIWAKIERQHPDWQLRLLGSGDQQLIGDMIKAQGLQHCKLIGFCDPFPHYEEASIVAMTSTTEGWGMVLVEGQEFGCVPVAFDSYASVRDVIKNERNGLLIRPFNLQEYARKLSLLMSDGKMRERLSHQSMEDVKRFNSQTIAKQWIQLFDRH